MTPRISIILPTYNYGNFLGGALRSVLAQTYPDLELLVIDDGSTDDTAHVVAPFLADGRVRYLRQPNRGPGAARNRGIDQAHGEFIAFVDADDRWLPTKLEKQIALFEAQPDLGLIYTRRLVIDAEGWQLAWREPPMYRGHVLPQLFRDNFICFSSTLVRRAALVEVGGFSSDAGHSEDYHLLLRLTARYAVDYVNEPLVLYRTGHANLSSQTEKRFRAVCTIMRQFLDGDGRNRLPPNLVRLAWAETFTHWGVAWREHSTRAACGKFLRALLVRPWHLEAWRGLAALAVPEQMRRWLRRWLQRPVDWRQRQRLAYWA
jgi:glycosyltransferase involved in cell wall biosynthesis